MTKLHRLDAAEPAAPHLSPSRSTRNRRGRTAVVGLAASVSLSLGLVAPVAASATPATQAAPATEIPSIDTPALLNTLSQPTAQRQAQQPATTGGQTGSAVAEPNAATQPAATGNTAPTTSGLPIPARVGFQHGPDGIDVSKWQHPGGVALNWEKVAASGQKFAFIKATDPTEGDSAYFVDDSVAASKAGLIVGSYHKAHPDQSATAQADAYAALLAKRDAAAPNAKTLPPVLDIELDKGLKPAALQAWTKEFLQRIEAKTGETPIVYTYRSFWKVQMGNSTDFTNYPLWLAAYQDNVPSDIPGGWTSMLFWQRSSTGKVNGIPTNVDLDVFNGTDAELTALADAH
nr:GH25 family lysozyme [Corynebacterium lactis]